MRIKNINKNEYFIEENGVKVFSYILTDDTLCAGSGDVLPNEELFIKNTLIFKRKCNKRKYDYTSC